MVRAVPEREIFYLPLAGITSCNPVYSIRAYPVLGKGMDCVSAAGRLSVEKLKGQVRKIEY